MQSFPSDDWLARAGSIQVTRNNFFYAQGGSVIGHGDLNNLPEEVRLLLIKKAITRRLAIQRGDSEGIYADQEALAYILPRLEVILEDYFYEESARRKAPGEALLEISDDPALAAFAAQRGFPEDQVRLQARRIAESYRKLQAQKHREQKMSELLQANPIEVRK